MSQVPPTEVYVMVLDYYEDDYKRPESGSEIIGVKLNKSDAYKTVFIKEYERNDVDEDCEGCKKYIELYKKLLKLTEITDEFIEEWEDARDLSLGESEYGVQPTGYTAKVEKCKIE